MIEFFLRSYPKIIRALGEHCAILGITLFFSLVIAFALTLLFAPHKKIFSGIVRVLSAVYAIPSLALFSLLIPVLGIGLKTAVFVLVLYNQFLLLRNFGAGLDNVEAQIVEAARGLGMTERQVILKIKMPLALPVIMAGIRLSVISTIGIGTIAAVVNAGGIGALLFDGLRTMDSAKIIAGALIAGLLALAANALLAVPESYVRKRLTFNAKDNVQKPDTNGEGADA